jgi:lipopolysaccharide biosynthesis glycosyltransferase
MLYIDSDAFIVDRLDLDYFEKLVSTSHTKDSILMVPSHRPVIEKIGYIRFSNPFNYYNAGFLVVNLSKKFTLPKFKTYLDTYGKSVLSISTFGDQDLINDYFHDSIKPLPLRYNVSTGLLKKTNFNKGALNYLVADEIKQVVIAHASGGILYSNKYYPFRKLILDIVRAGINSPQLQADHKLIFQSFYSNINNRFEINKFRQFFGLTSECSPSLYDTGIHWKKVIRKILNDTGIHWKKVIRKI